MDLEHANQESHDTAPCEQDIDFSLLRDSLRMTPWERFLENERALAFIRMLESAQKDQHGPPRANS